MTTDFERRRRQRRRNRMKRAQGHRLEVAAAIAISVAALAGLLAVGYLGKQDLLLDQRELAFWANQGIEIARW